MSLDVDPRDADGAPDAELPPPPPAGWESMLASAGVAPPVRRWSRASMAVGAVAVAGSCLYLGLVDPNTSSAYPQCPLRLLTGWDCAGCGGLRATHALITGDLAGAADHNLLLVVAAPLLAYAVLRVVLERATGRRLPAIPWHPAATWFVVALVLVFSVVRNLAWGPFPYLYSDAL